MILAPVTRQVFPNGNIAFLPKRNIDHQPSWSKRSYSTTERCSIFYKFANTVHRKRLTLNYPIRLL